MVSAQNSDSSAIDALRSKGYRATPQRIAICRIVMHSREHPTAKMIYDIVKKVHPTVSLATVYNTLEVLRDLNLIQELTFPGNKARFDSYMKAHVNLICLQCGNIEDVEDPTTGIISEKISISTKFEPKGQRIDVYGTCPKCSKANNDQN